MDFINQQEGLQRSIRILHEDSQSYLACDTEFIRQKTFYPELCLMQFGTSNHCFLIDALAFEPSQMAALFFDHTKTFVFHSCKQDLEIIYHLYGRLPLFVFDTQIASAFLGLGESISYEGLVQHYLNTPLDKTQQYTDWKARPLSEKQLAYAADDVIFLTKIYPLILKDLQIRGYLEWALEDMIPLSKTSTFEEIPLSRIHRLNISKKHYAHAKTLFEFREIHAKRLNINRNQFFSDKAIESLVKLQDPLELESYAQTHLPLLVKQNLIEELIHILLHTHLEDVPSPKKMTDSQQKELSFLQNKRDTLADELHFPRSLLATSSDLRQHILYQNGRIQETWRKKILEL